MKGRKALAPSTLNMFPKLELAPIRMYLRIFAKTLRPSITPPSSTMRSFSSKIRSADSFAISVDTDDSLLVGGRQAREERGLLRRVRQLGVRHFLYVAAEEHGVGREAHVLANLSADKLVIAGEDFYCHAVIVKGLDGTSRGVLGRVQKRDVSFEH